MATYLASIAEIGGVGFMFKVAHLKQRRLQEKEQQDSAVNKKAVNDWNSFPLGRGGPEACFGRQPP